MRLKMLATVLGSPDGFGTVRYWRGHVYDTDGDEEEYIPSWVAARVLRNKQAVNVSNLNILLFPTTEYAKKKLRESL